MGGWIRKNFRLLMSFLITTLILAVVLLVMCVTKNGAIAKKIISDYPLISYFLPKLSAALGCEIDIIAKANPGIFLEFCETLIIAVTHIVIAAVMYLIFLKLPEAVNLVRTARINLWEDFMKSPLYICTDIQIQKIASIAAIIIAQLIVGAINIMLGKIDNEIIQVILSAVILIGVALLYSWFNSFLKGIKFKLACLSTGLVDIAWGILATFITSAAYISFYIAVIYKCPVLLIVIVYIINCAWYFLRKLIEKWIGDFVPVIESSMGKNRQTFDTITLFAMLFLYLMSITGVLVPILTGSKVDIETSPVYQAMYSLPFLADFVDGISILHMMTYNFIHFTMEFGKLIILGIICCVIHKNLRTRNLLVWYLSQCVAIVVTLGIYGVIMMLFNMEDKLIALITVCMIFVIVLLIGNVFKFILQSLLMSVLFVGLYALIYQLTAGSIDGETFVFVAAFSTLPIFVIMYGINWFTSTD